jgi:hypothetical protein
LSPTWTRCWRARRGVFGADLVEDLDLAVDRPPSATSTSELAAPPKHRRRWWRRPEHLRRGCRRNHSARVVTPALGPHHGDQHGVRRCGDHRSGAAALPGGGRARIAVAARDAFVRALPGPTSKVAVMPDRNVHSLIGWFHRRTYRPPWAAELNDTIGHGPIRPRAGRWPKGGWSLGRSGALTNPRRYAHKVDMHQHARLYRGSSANRGGGAVRRRAARAGRGRVARGASGVDLVEVAHCTHRGGGRRRPGGQRAEGLELGDRGGGRGVRGRAARAGRGRVAGVDLVEVAHRARTHHGSSGPVQAWQASSAAAIAARWWAAGVDQAAPERRGSPRRARRAAPQG